MNSLCEGLVGTAETGAGIRPSARREYAYNLRKEPYRHHYDEPDLRRQYT
jgi:hypothetical protein